ncbi:DUF5343 domain-containing protein [Qipengyuania psychrotolerans]|uniref:DUF5343 domain-containing protein n=1 Tax=Qipengyuania psychrotolerans TaxID=2867238 RepID=A0ABX8ZEC7_9SPHN|nr:DUF5343 domain-containing protein [Qipengyuania psychrotolerans]QZD87342.1 DUF5343 domain-containing protein [Qipengyuania psychrotolerans]
MSHPYVPSGGILQSAISQFRQSFPAKIDSDTLKKLAIASGNENGVINVLKYLEAVNQENKRTQIGQDLFSLHDDQEFGEKLSELVESAYSDLFELRSNGAWNANQDDLISFFRRSDGTSAVVGKRQAITFQTLASLSGKREEEILTRGPRGPNKVSKKKVTLEPRVNEGAQKPPKPAEKVVVPRSGSDVALTVRVEVNLPANASKDAYDHIFASIKKNLIDGNS